MLLLISPAKSLDFDSPLPRTPPITEPQDLDRSQQLIGLLRKKSARQIGALMELSENLSELNVARYRDWSLPFTDTNARPAVYAFDGDVYGGLEVHTLKKADVAWAQQHLAILSGLHGVLRPLDRIQPYRLEMSIPLANPRGKSLYAFWGARIAETLNERLAGEASPLVINLASQEYFRAVDTKALNARVVECVFEDEQASGQYKIISFLAKRARGLMARWAITQRATGVRKLQAFTGEGFAYAKEISTRDRLVFRRRLADRPPPPSQRAARDD